MQDVNFKEPIRKWTSEERKDLNLRYYNQNMHRAAFVLPEFADRVSVEAAWGGRHPREHKISQK